jgi:hypothetical protein
MSIFPVTLIIEGDPVPSLNEYLGPHWSKGYRLKQAWIKKVYDAAGVRISAKGL